jgi:uncharacterized membrane protein
MVNGIKKPFSSIYDVEIKREFVVYAAYLLIFVILVGTIVATPILAFESNVDGIYSAFTVACHQKLTRSLCVFKSQESMWIADCTPQSGEYLPGAEDRNAIRVEHDGIIGYKMPVCSRDIGLYGAMLAGALAYPLSRELEDKDVLPPVFLVLALVPIALDGGIQFVSELGLLPFLYESTNMIRIITGSIAGFAASFYAIPLVMNLFEEQKPKIPPESENP